ncbi:hypothetical protein [Oceaniferula marina]|uniref:hypothetical protein n=1 Tax=Oceaniferula marina TaxID=2748318 RepID=UPI001D05548E|nr:hypothetical protein [Oceaniferula marina]
MNCATEVGKSGSREVGKSGSREVGKSDYRGRRSRHAASVHNQAGDSEGPGLYLYPRY